MSCPRAIRAAVVGLELQRFLCAKAFNHKEKYDDFNDLIFWLSLSTFPTQKHDLFRSFCSRSKLRFNHVAHITVFRTTLMYQPFTHSAKF